MLLKKGERGLLVGQTGSGKTQDAIFQLRNTSQWPVIVFDTKIEDAFLGLAEGDETQRVVNSYAEFDKLSKQPRKDWPDFIIVRPEYHEVVAVDPLDNYAHLAFQKFGAAFIYFDEMFNWHNNGRPVSGVLQLLQRGRSRGKTTLMAAQRPAWLSRFCLTESQKFYIHRLTDEQDWSRLSEVVPRLMVVEKQRAAHAVSRGEKALFPRYYFWHFEQGEHDEPVLFKPVPLQETPSDEEIQEKNGVWI